MKLSDRRVIEILAKSPLESFAAMLEILQSLDGAWMWEEIEYELFDDSLGDNQEGKISIRVPSTGGISANVLFAFTQHAITFDLVRRRLWGEQGTRTEPAELRACYELTPSGSYMCSLLEALAGVTGPVRT
ncbi:MAG TPA: hypothetical protein VGC54_10665 [Planctomycetota bacterium]